MADGTWGLQNLGVNSPLFPAVQTPMADSGLRLGQAPTIINQAAVATGGLFSQVTDTTPTAWVNTLPTMTTQVTLFTSEVSPLPSFGSKAALSSVSVNPPLTISSQATLSVGAQSVLQATNSVASVVAFGGDEVLSVADPRASETPKPSSSGEKAPEEQMRSHVLRISSAVGFCFKLPDNSADVWFVEESVGGGRRVAVHKCVLSSLSPVFFNLFKGEWKEMHDGVIPAPKEYTFEAFSAVIDVMYGQDVSVDADIISDMYALACSYKLDCVKCALAQSIPQWGKEANDLILKFGEEEECELLKTAVVGYICHHLDSLSGNCSICDLSYELVICIAQSEDISASELDLCKFLSKWATAHDSMPAKDLNKIFSHVRYGIVAANDLLAQMASHKFYVGNGERFAIANAQCSQLHIAALEEHAILFTPRRAQSTCSLQIFSNENEQLYAFVYAGQRKVTISATWNDLYSHNNMQPPTIEVKIKGMCATSESTAFCLDLCSVCTKTSRKPHAGLVSRFRAFTLQPCTEGIKYWLTLKGADPEWGELHTASHTVSVAATLPWLVKIKQKYMDQTLKLEMI